MAIRYAGDIFSRGFEEEKGEPSSYLTDYFPDLKNLSKKGSASVTGEAKSTGGFQAASPFAGFKPMSKKEEIGVPVFAGFKTSGYKKD